MNLKDVLSWNSHNLWNYAKKYRVESDTEKVKLQLKRKEEKHEQKQ